MQFSPTSPSIPRRTLAALASGAVAALGCAGAAHAGQLPTVSVTTRAPIAGEEKVPARIRVDGGARMRAGIELRGQSSQRFPKQSYGVELRDRSGDDRDVALLGMPADGDWVLSAPYNDKTLMRNVVAYAAARAMGRWAPRTRFVELRLNGDYRGVYVLTERPELGQRRMSGRWMVEWTFPFQARDKGPFFRSPITNEPFVWADPDRDELSGARARGIRAGVGGAEKALYRGGDWRAHIDEAAAIDYLLLQELMRNVDVFRASTFMALGRSGRIEFGPAWDFDLSSGNVSTQPSGDTTGWYTPDRRWAQRLWQDQRFRVALRARWRALRRDGFPRKVLDVVRRSERQLTPGPAGRNFGRWPILGVRVWRNPVARGSYRAEVAYLRRYLRARMAWMSNVTQPDG